MLLVVKKRLNNELRTFEVKRLNLFFCIETGNGRVSFGIKGEKGDVGNPGLPGAPGIIKMPYFGKLTINH